MEPFEGEEEKKATAGSSFVKRKKEKENQKVRHFGCKWQSMRTLESFSLLSDWQQHTKYVRVDEEELFTTIVWYI